MAPAIVALSGTTFSHDSQDRRNTIQSVTVSWDIYSTPKLGFKSKSLQIFTHLFCLLGYLGSAEEALTRYNTTQLLHVQCCVSVTEWM